MAPRSKFSAEVRERAVRMVLDHRAEIRIGVRVQLFDDACDQRRSAAAPIRLKSSTLTASGRGRRSGTGTGVDSSALA